MSTNARTWFYQEPEKNAFAIVERLNGTFWQARVVQVIFTACVQMDPPVKVQGFWRDETIEVEWQPKEWFALRAKADPADLLAHVTHIVGMKPAFRYEDPDGRHVIEWHRDAAQSQSRWQSLQGQPAYKGVQRL